MAYTSVAETSVHTAERHGVSFREAFWVWARIAALSFGGPAGQIAVMYRILVEEKRWISETRFLYALNYCMLLPGPEAQQLVIYIGWMLHRIRGGLVAGILFIVPGYVSLMVLSWLYAGYGDIGIVQALFFGLKAAVLAVVLEAVVKVGKRALKNRTMIAVAGLSFIGIFFFAVPFPLIIATAAVIGIVGNAVGLVEKTADVQVSRISGDHEGSAKRDEGPAAIDAAFADHIPEHVRPSLRRAIKVSAVCLTVWLGPLIVLMLTLGPANVFTGIATFFTKMAVVTFGGAYAVLAYVAQEVVQTYHWLKPGEMLSGLGMAETTPGPLISVVQFVGFMAAFRHPGPLDPMLAGALGGTLAKWMTFAPCFLWVFLGGPYIEALRGNRALNSALSSITAAVVGVILNLAIWFALHTLFGQVDVKHAFGMVLEIPLLVTLNITALILAVIALLALFRFKVGMIPTLLGCSVIGVILNVLGVI